MSHASLLSVQFAGIELENPIVAASATPGWDAVRLTATSSFGPGAVVTKTLVPTRQIKQHPRCGRYSLVRLGARRLPIGMVNADTMSNLPLEEWLESHLKGARVGRAKLFVSIAALESPEATAKLAERVASLECADLLELNASCPMEGNSAGSVPEQAAQHVKAVKDSVRLPVTFKLSADLQKPMDIVEAVEEAGADGLVMTNSVSGFAGVDIATGRPRMPCQGGYSGPAIKPIVQGLIIEVARQSKLPIAAVGGISCWEDVVEYILLGATVVETATGLMWNGPEFIKTLAAGLSSYLDQHGYGDLREMRGQSLRYVRSLEEYAGEARKVAVIGADCTRCGMCVARCWYGAISDRDGIYSVDQTTCDGCGLCAEWCPKNAIRLGVRS